MTPGHKYKEGTKLKVLKAFDDNGRNFLVGEVIELYYGTKFSGDYEIKGHKEVGWMNAFFDNEKKFEIAKIDNWKDELEAG